MIDIFCFSYCAVHICWSTEIQREFPAGLPSHEGLNLHNFRLHPRSPDCSSPHDATRHSGLHTCLHAHRLGFASGQSQFPTLSSFSLQSNIITTPCLNYTCTTSHTQQIAQACKPVVQRAGFWGSVQTLARGYEIIMGLLLFTPVAFLAWFPFVSEFQTRMLFNQAFSRGLQISRILGGHRKDRSSRNKE